MEKLVTYKITADGDMEDIDKIAVTSNPAIMIKGVKLSAQAQIAAKFSEDEERMVIAGPAMVPDLKIYRKDEDGEYYVTFTQDVIQQLVAKFAKGKTGQVFNVEHTDTDAPMFVMEHWIVEDPEMDKCRKFGFTDLPKGTWFVMAKVESKEFWDKEVKSNEKFGFSIEGLLGLKLNKQTKMNKFKHKYVATLKFDGDVAETAEGVEVIVAADSIEVGQPVVVVDETYTPDAGYTGDVLIGEETVTIADGEITAVEPVVAEELSETEVTVETEEEEEEAVETEMAEEVVEEEVTEEDTELAEVPVAITADEINAMIDTKLKDLYDLIAEIKGAEAEAEDTTEEVAMSAVDTKTSALTKMSAFLKK